MARTTPPAARSKGRPTLVEAGEIDRLIKQAAIKVLSEQGEAATVHAVATEANLSRRSLYARYPTKEALFFAVLRDMLSIAEPLRFERGATLEESVRHYVLCALKTTSTPGARAIHRMMMLNPDYVASLQQEMASAIRTIFATPLEALLVEVLEPGRTRVTDVKAASATLLKLVLMPDSAIGVEEQPIEEKAAMLTDMFLYGICGTR